MHCPALVSILETCLEGFRLVLHPMAPILLAASSQRRRLCSWVALRCIPLDFAGRVRWRMIETVIWYLILPLSDRTPRVLSAIVLASLRWLAMWTETVRAFSTAGWIEIVASAVSEIWTCGVLLALGVPVASTPATHSLGASSASILANHSLGASSASIPANHSAYHVRLCYPGARGCWHIR